MENYQLSTKAEIEIEGIYEYSILNFGLRKAREYFTGLHDRLAVLADHPSWGNDYSHIKPQLCRYEYNSHSIYYLPTSEGIFVVRVLGNRQNPALHM